MAGPYYVDPAASGDNNGSDWANAWTNVQSAFDTVAAGEICYLRGTQTFADATTIDVDTRTGLNAAGPIRFIGCNAGGTVDGTRFVINVNSKAVHGLSVTTTADGYWMENIEVKNAGAGGDSKHGIYFTADARGWTLINCCANTCSGSGFHVSSGTYIRFIRCCSYNNTESGFYGNPSGYAIMCSAYGNTVAGFNYSIVTSSYIGCIAHANGTGLISAENGYLLLNSVIDANTSKGIDNIATTGIQMSVIIGNRITNHSGAGDIGLDCNSEPITTGWNYFEANDGDNLQEATLHREIPYWVTGATEAGEGATTNIHDSASITDCGYVNSAGDDFSTDYTSATNPTLRRTAITIPWR